jgi:uncharacterized protein YecT (DUF1311 family)
MKNAAIVLTITLLTTSVFAAQKKKDKPTDVLRKSVQECMNNDASTMGMRACLANGMEGAQPLLSAAVDAASENANDTETHKRFLSAQKAWSKYTDAECKYNSAEMLGGTGEALIYDSCIFEMTLDRVDALNGESK